MNIHFQIVSVEGEVIQSIAIKQVCESLSRHEIIDYDKLEGSLHNSLISLQSIPFTADLPDNVLFNVKLDVCESASSLPQEGWNLVNSTSDKRPLFVNSSQFSITPLSSIYAGQMVYQIFASIKN